MLLITLVMLIVGYVFWTYWEQPTAAQIATANAEIDSLQVIIDKAKQDLASGTVEDLRRKVEQYQALLGVMRRLVPEKNEVPALIDDIRSEEHTSELQSRVDLVCRLLLEKKKKKINQSINNKRE